MLDKEISLVLASKSPRRIELIKLITPQVTVAPADVEETVLPGLAPYQVAEHLSRIKACHVAVNYPGRLVLGADTIVVADGCIMGKPKDRADCRRMIEALSGRTHQVYTGVTLVRDSQVDSFYAVTDVTFFPLTDEEIAHYVASDEPYDKAGGYAIQGKASLFVREIRGDYFNVIGLPVSMIYQRLKQDAQ